MCWKKLFGNTDPVPSGRSEKILLTFAINSYGGGNDLNGCINDQLNVIKNLPDFNVRYFKDSQVTRKLFSEACSITFKEAIAGDVIVLHFSGHGTYVKDTNYDEDDFVDEALYLHDGALIDDDINKLMKLIPEGVMVLVLLDSCFSQSATRKLNAEPNKNKGRFLKTDNSNTNPNINKNPVFKDLDKWIVLSGCMEHETSADACISGKFNGAFTYFAMKTLDRNLTYKQWYEKIRVYLPSKDFAQTPTLEGPEEMLNKTIFT